MLMEYMEHDVLPSDETLAKVVFESPRFSLMDVVLYFLDGGLGGNYARPFL